MDCGGRRQTLFLQKHSRRQHPDRHDLVVSGQRGYVGGQERRLGGEQGLSLEGLREVSQPQLAVLLVRGVHVRAVPCEVELQPVDVHLAQIASVAAGQGVEQVGPRAASGD